MRLLLVILLVGCGSKSPPPPKNGDELGGTGTMRGNPAYAVAAYCVRDCRQRCPDCSPGCETLCATPYDWCFWPCYSRLHEHSTTDIAEAECTGECMRLESAAAEGPVDAGLPALTCYDACVLRQTIDANAAPDLDAVRAGCDAECAP